MHLQMQPYRSPDWKHVIHIQSRKLEFADLNSKLSANDSDYTTPKTC
jgi:hypothetical protein